MSDNSTERMRRFREKRKQEGMEEISVWLTQSQLRVLRSMAASMEISQSEVAQFLITKNSRYLEAGLMQVKDKRVK